MTPYIADAPTLETPRFRLRAPLPRDAAVWQSFFMSERAQYVGGGIDCAPGRAWRGFASIVGHWTIRGCGLFILEDRATGQTIGAAGPWFPEEWPEPEIGWSLWRPEAEGTGAMAEAVPVIRAHVYDHLGWTTAVSYIDPANARSIALAERLGATRDYAARGPDPSDLVYRHPGPEAAI